VASLSTMIDPELARAIRIVGLDVDGVLTDGGIYLGDVNGARHEFKRYDIQDGLGVYFMRSAGLIPIIVTGRVSVSVELRARELGIEHVAQDPDAQKLIGLRRILDRLQLGMEHVAFVGDDFPDLAIMRRVAMPVAVGNAVPEIRAAASVQLSKSGGFGAVREFSEMLLRARGEWDEVVNRYVAERSGEPREVTVS
jgi:3-deoxy-D-manno-octulosonate 8-phosphate phosphatase (KDO 8-P phosphatase)